ncbi:MAG: universal stress protein [Proteobacteria bacterium]|nr:universal stress protein [Pseudomonadota bacterium]
MIKNILVPIDGSVHASAALEAAIWLAAKFEAAIVGVHVVDIVALEGPFLHDLSASIGFEPSMNFSSKVKAALEEKGIGLLEEVKERCKKAGVACSTVMASGVVSTEICDKSNSADIVVMGRRGANENFDNSMLGAVTEAVVRKASKHVLVVPRSFTSPTSMLLAYDGSASSSKALRAAAECSATLSLPLTVISVAENPDTDSTLSEAEDYLKPYKVEVEFIQKSGDPHTEVEQYCKETEKDFLFIGTTHHGRIAEMVLGSTTEHLLRSLEGLVYIAR